MMANFDIEEYDLVETRIRKLYELYPDARIITEWANDTSWMETQPASPRIWVVKASIYLTADDQEKRLAKATGYACEHEVGKQATWALELSETSSIGRALANMNLSGNKRASQTEMEKVARSEQTDWLALAEGILNVDDLRNLYTRAKAQGAPVEVLEKLKDYASALNTSSEDSGTGRSVQGSRTKR